MLFGKRTIADAVSKPGVGFHKFGNMTIGAKLL